MRVALVIAICTSMSILGTQVIGAQPPQGTSPPGMLKAIQCKMSSVFFCGATSGSCMISTKLTVFGGTFDHSSFGDTGFGSAWVYFFGISEPSANAVVVRVRPGPGAARELSEGLPTDAQLPDGTVQGKNRRGNPGYMGPGAPAAGPHHHYTFELFALDTKLDLKADASRADVLKAMDGHILGKAVLVGRFHR